MGRHSCCYKQKLRKGLWSPEEDEKLLRYISKHGHGCWSSIPKVAGLQRCGKSCRLRWINYLRPDLKRGTFSQQEENLIIELHSRLGNRWSQIAAQLPGRTDNEIKNLWNSSIKKKLMQNGVDPNTHKPLSEVKNEGKEIRCTSKSPEKATGELNTLISLNLKADNSKPSVLNEISSCKIKKRENNLSASNSQEFFPNKTFSLNEYPNIQYGLLDSTGCLQFPFQQLNDHHEPRPSGLLGPSSALWPNQKCRLFEPDQESNSKTIPPTFSSSVQSSQIFQDKISSGLPCHGIGTYNYIHWDSGNCSRKSSEFQNRSLSESNIFPWGLADECGSSNKTLQLHSKVAETTDIKWAEYLNAPFLAAASEHNPPTLPS